MLSGRSNASIKLCASEAPFCQSYKIQYFIRQISAGAALSNDFFAQDPCVSKSVERAFRRRL